MKYIHIDNVEIPYQIAKKRNKNTYFYFKKDGYIQINLSKYQSEKDALEYIKSNSKKFIDKLTKNKKTDMINELQFLYKGRVYDTLLSENNVVTFYQESNVVSLPTTDINNNVIKLFYKDEMMKLLHHFHQKYIDNPYVDLSGVTYKTRYTTSRHGSCNARKRNINMNLHLIKYDVKYIEYVYLHEITHLVHQNHGPKFYDLLSKLCPNYNEIKQELKEIYR